MGRKEITQFYDDLTGESLNVDEVHTMAFSFDGVPYTIDLSEENLALFRSDMERWIKAASRVKPRRVGGQKPRSRPDMPLIRQWAIDNGYKVSDRGRVPREIVEKYDNR